MLRYILLLIVLVIVISMSSAIGEESSNANIINDEGGTVLIRGGLHSIVGTDAYEG